MMSELPKSSKVNGLSKGVGAKSGCVDTLKRKIEQLEVIINNLKQEDTESEKEFKKRKIELMKQKSCLEIELVTGQVIHADDYIIFGSEDDYLNNK